jgi:hypothetical protein
MSFAATFRRMFDAFLANHPDSSQTLPITQEMPSEDGPTYSEQENREHRRFDELERMYREETVVA